MQCPKCGRATWLCEMGESTWLKCTCGKLIPVEVINGGVRRVYHQSPSMGSLPRAGTKLSLCLGTLVGRGTCDTKTLSTLLNQSTSETASQLSLLQAKGLVDKENSRKGVAGGSVWILTPAAIALYE